MCVCLVVGWFSVFGLGEDKWGVFGLGVGQVSQSSFFMKPMQKHSWSSIQITRVAGESHQPGNASICHRNDPSLPGFKESHGILAYLLIWCLVRRGQTLASPRAWALDERRTRPRSTARPWRRGRQPRRKQGPQPGRLGLRLIPERKVKRAAIARRDSRRLRGCGIGPYDYLRPLLTSILDTGLKYDRQ